MTMWIGRLKSSPRLSKRGEYNDGKAPSVYPTSYGPTKASHMKNLEVHSQPGSPRMTSLSQHNSSTDGGVYFD